MSWKSILNYQHYVEKEKGWTKAFEKAVEDLEKEGGGTIYVPAGKYETCSIELKSNMTLYLETGSRLEYFGELEKYKTINFSYIGRPMCMYMPLIYARKAEHVMVCGQGVIDGHGENWWRRKAEFRKKGLRRPHMICFDHCRNVKVKDVTLINSPAWTIHPCSCDQVLIQGVSIKNPADSPNTDGINPNSSRNVRIENCVIDVGDDCIAIKSGTEDSENPEPCENVIISNCNMIHGHGGIVIGSEMSGGIRNVVVTNCVFQDTDRGIRIKSRRKRGGIVEQIRIQNIIMEKVICPFIVNLYYFCGEKGKEKYVWDKNPYPVDQSTPMVREVRISHVSVYQASAAAGFFYGLKEMPIQDISIEDSVIWMDPDGKPGKPAMMDGVDPVKGAGFILKNVSGIHLSKVVIHNYNGSMIDADETARFIID